MPKYIDENVAQAIANDIQKNRVLLGAFDTIDTSNANYNLIHRNGWRVDLGKFTFYEHGSVQHLFTASLVLTNAKLPQDNNIIANISCAIYTSYFWNQVETANLQIALSNDGSIRIYDESCNTAADLMAKISGIILQYELADNLKYTEKVIKGVPILNLDQNGANWLRSEWEKGINLYSGSQNVGGTNLINDVITLDNPIILKAGKTYIMNANTNALHPFLVLYNSSNVDVGEFFLNNAITPTSDIEVKKIAFYYDGNGGTRGTFTYSNIMLNEGDHAYPYQPYNGAIVHEKEIENMAKTNVDNNFSTTQTIYGADDTTLRLKCASGQSHCNIVFLSQTGSQLGNIGFNSSYKPEIYSMLSHSFVNLLTEDDIAELKSLVYDNIYPAVVDYEVEYATYFALPNSVDGDPLIFGAGTDLLELKGNSVVVNQLVQGVASSSSTNGIIFTKVDNDTMTISGTAEARVSIGVPNGHIDVQYNHTYLIMGMEKNTQSVGLIFNAFGSGGYVTTYSGMDTGNGLIVVNSNSSVTELHVEVVIDNGTALSKTYTIKPKVIDLTQFFGSNDNIPSDLLSNPSLFTTKYWKGSLAYDTGHIESAKPKAIVSYGFNIWDEEWEIGDFNTDGTTHTDNSKIRSKNFIRVVPNANYYINVYSGVYFYDKDKNFIEAHIYNGQFTTPANCVYIKFHCASAYGSTYNHDICINISNSSMNGTYLPHIAPKRYLINVGTDNSVNGVNTIKDNMGVLNTDRAVGKYTFTGNEGWVQRASGTNCDRYYLPYSSLGLTNVKQYAKVICSCATEGNAYSGDEPYYISTDEVNLYITVPLGVNPNAVFTNTQTLYFELTEPYTEENPQDAILPTNIEIQKGGSIEIESDLPCDITFEVAVSKVY